MHSIRNSLGRISGFLHARKNVADAAITLVVRVLSAVLAYGVQVIIVRFLAMEQYGIYVTLWTWLIIANFIAVFGFSESSLRFLPRYYERKQYHWAIGFLKTGFWFSTVGAIVVSIIGLSTLWVLGDNVSDSYIIPLIVLVVGLPVMAVELYLEGVSRAFGWYMLTVIPVYTLRPMLIAAGILTAYYLGYQPDAAMVLAFAVIITAGIVIAQSIIILTRLKKKFGTLKGSRPRKIWVTSSLPLVLSTGVDELYNWSDILILSFMVPAPEVAIYFAAQRSMSLASFIQYAFMLVSTREFSLANAMRDKVELQKRISNATRWTFWLTLPAVALTYAAGYPLLRMFGSEFVVGLPIMGLLGIGMIFRASVGQASDLLIVMGHQYANMMISVGSLLFNILFSIYLVPRFGIIGVALATTITFAFRSLIITIVTRKLTGLWVLADFPVFETAEQTKKQTHKYT